jgi:hypothetical protein
MFSLKNVVTAAATAVRKAIQRIVARLSTARQGDRGETTHAVYQANTIEGPSETEKYEPEQIEELESWLSRSSEDWAEHRPPRLPRELARDNAEKDDSSIRETVRYVARQDPSGIVLHDKHNVNDSRGVVDGNDRGPQRAAMQDSVPARRISAKEDKDNQTMRTESSRRGDRLTSQVNQVIEQQKSRSETQPVMSSGIYSGKILSVNEGDVVQKTNANQIVYHKTTMLDQTPSVGQNVTIAYRKDRGHVRNLLEKSQVRELGLGR